MYSIVQFKCVIVASRCRVMFCFLFIVCQLELLSVVTATALECHLPVPRVNRDSQVFEVQVAQNAPDDANRGVQVSHMIFHFLVFLTSQCHATVHTQVSVLAASYFVHPSSSNLGIAVKHAIGNGNGMWQWKGREGGVWHNLTYNFDKEKLLGNDSSVRFVPNLDFSSNNVLSIVGVPIIVFYAWDEGARSCLSLEVR